MINVGSLQKIYDEKTFNKTRTYEVVLEKLNKHILASADKGFQDCVFVVPVMIFGYPKYDIDHCMKYIVFKINENGFHYKLINRNTIYVSWKMKVLQERIEPIAMPQVDIREQNNGGSSSSGSNKKGSSNPKDFELVQMNHSGFLDMLPVNKKYVPPPPPSHSQKPKQMLLTFFDDNK